MRIAVDGGEVHVATGGRSHARGRPFIVFLHGAGANHLTWVLQTRALAYDGWNVMAPDMPGHFLSDGEPLESIETQALWLSHLLEAAGCASAVLVGHSQGGLIALELAKLAPEKVEAIVFIATAAAIPVNPSLIGMAEKEEEKAFAAMTSWAYGPDAHLHDNSWPGGSHVNFAIDLMRRNRKGALAVDLKSCAAYSRGLEVAAGLTCPTLCIFAGLDRMTVPKNGKALAQALPDNELLMVEGSGHTLPTEKPREVNAAIRRFVARLGAALAVSRSA